MDVERQQLARGGGLEVAQHLGMVLVPVLQPAPLELALGADALIGEGPLIGRGELALVVLQAGAQPIKGIAGVEDEQGFGVIPVQFTEVAAAFDQGSAIAVAPAPGGAGDAVHVGVGRPAIDALQQRPALSTVVVEGQGQGVGPPVH